MGEKASKVYKEFILIVQGNKLNAYTNRFVLGQLPSSPAGLRTFTTIPHKNKQTIHFKKLPSIQWIKDQT